MRDYVGQTDASLKFAGVSVAPLRSAPTPPLQGEAALCSPAAACVNAVI